MDIGIEVSLKNEDLTSISDNGAYVVLKFGKSNVRIEYALLERVWSIVDKNTIKVMETNLSNLDTGNE